MLNTGLDIQHSGILPQPRADAYPTVPTGGWQINFIFYKEALLEDLLGSGQENLDSSASGSEGFLPDYENMGAQGFSPPPRTAMYLWA